MSWAVGMSQQLYIAVSAEIIRHWEPMRVYHSAASVVLVEPVPITDTQHRRLLLHQQRTPGDSSEIIPRLQGGASPKFAASCPRCARGCPPIDSGLVLRPHEKR